MEINKLALSAILSLNLCFAGDDINASSTLKSPLSKIDGMVQNYEINKIMQNRGVTFHDLKVAFKKEFPSNWFGYMFDIDITHNSRRFTAKDMIFTDGNVIANQIQSFDGLDYKRLMHPALDESYYDKKFLIAGNENAKHRVVIFSEPLCPACVNVLPQYIKEISSSPEQLSLYYIPMPLDMHHTAKFLVKASNLAKSQGIKDVSLKLYNATSNIYKTNPRMPFDPYEEKSEQKALDLFNGAVGTKYTLEDIKKAELDSEVSFSLELANAALIDGTPTIFFDGEIDIYRNKHRQFIK